MNPKIIRCTRCNRRCRNGEGWNVNLSRGVAVEIICPACQTATENAEAEINEATLDYLGLDDTGRLRGRPKHTDDDTE